MALKTMSSNEAKQNWGSVMSTVDNGSLAIGQVAVGLSLRDELAGRSGQYGMGRDASAMMPQVEPSAEAQ